MQKKDWMNGLIPADDLHWDEDDKKYVVVSKEEQDKLFKACFGCGLEEKETLRIFRCFTYYKTSEVLFKHFLEGNIGIYSFDDNGSPIFEKLKHEEQILDLVYSHSKTNEDTSTFIDSVDTEEGVLSSSQPRDLVPFERMYKAITKWCRDKGFNLWEKENPDDESTWLQERDEELSKEIREKGWRLNCVDSNNGCLRLQIVLGRWFEFYGEDE